MTDQMGTNLQKPRGDQTILTVAMPRDTNTNGDIFGGWLLSQMDIAGGVAASRRAQGRAVTVAVEEMEFHLPVQVGNLVACYAEIIKTGNSSMTIKIEVWASPHDQTRDPDKVTEGVFTYVAIDENRKPRSLPPL